MNNVYLFLFASLVSSFIILFNYDNFSYAELDVHINNTDNNSNVNLSSYLMNDTNDFFVQYIQGSGLNGKIINKTVLYDSNKNEFAIEYNKSSYYKTATKKEENSFKKTLSDVDFFSLPSSYPNILDFENITDKEYNSYNLTVGIDNATNSVYWIDKEYTTAPPELYLVKDKIENWTKSSSLLKQHRPLTILTPTCGPVEGFGFNLMVNWFAPNSIVRWELLDQYQLPALLGYFKTNKTGGFNETSHATDIFPGKYQLHMYDVKGKSGKDNWVGKETFTEFSLPCDPNSNSTILQMESIINKH